MCETTESTVISFPLHSQSILISRRNRMRMEFLLICPNSLLVLTLFGSRHPSDQSWNEAHFNGVHWQQLCCFTIAFAYLLLGSFDRYRRHNRIRPTTKTAFMISWFRAASHRTQKIDNAIDIIKFCKRRRKRFRFRTNFRCAEERKLFVVSGMRKVHAARVKDTRFTWP